MQSWWNTCFNNTHTCKCWKHLIKISQNAKVKVNNKCVVYCWYSSGKLAQCIVTVSLCYGKSWRCAKRFWLLSNDNLSMGLMEWGQIHFPLTVHFFISEYIWGHRLDLTGFNRPLCITFTSSCFTPPCKKITKFLITNNVNCNHCSAQILNAKVFYAF